MHAPLRVSLVWTAIAVMAPLSISTLAFGFDANINKASLRGLEGVYVSVEKLNPEIEKDGLTEDLIRKDTELKLKGAGIRALSKKEWLSVEGSPYLYVSVNALKLRETNEYIYAIHIAFRQNVYPVREPIPVLGATTWSVGGIVGITHRLDKMRTSVKGQMDQFISAYLSVNPK
jgi:hypothetical protein